MATTINAYSVSLALDARGYIDASKVSRAETAALARDIASARNPMEVYIGTVDRLERALAAGAIDLATFSRLLEQAKSKLDAATPSVESAAQAEARYNRQLAETNRLRQEFGRTGASVGLSNMTAQTNSASSSLLSLAGRFAGPVAGIYALKSAVGASFETEKAMASLEVLTGSAENAALMLKDLRAIDAQSPLTFASGLQASRTLISFGVEVDKIIPTLKQLGDVTGADNERFKSMALAFAQVSAAGRLQGQDLRQMIDAGFNPLQEVSRKTGESLVELKARMEAGGISSKEVADAFASATGEGGKFEGMMDKLGQTASGKFGQMVSKIQQIGVQIGDAVSPVIIQLVDLFNQIAPVLEPVLWVIKKMGEGLSFIVALANDVIAVFKAFGGLARGEALSMGEVFAFENSSKLLENARYIDETTQATTYSVEQNAAAMAKVADNAERAKEGAKQLKDQMAENAKNAQAFSDKISEMQAAITAKKTGVDKSSMNAEVEAIKQLFDMTTTEGRNAKGLFEYQVAAGVDYNKHMDRLLNKDQQAQLEKFRSLQQQTQEIEKQEKTRERYAKIREQMMKDATAISDRADPIGKLSREIQDLQILLDSGMINTRAFDIEAKRLAEESVKSKGKVEAPKSIEVGSQEAYKFLTGQTDVATKQLNEQAATKNLIAAQNRILERIENKPTITRRR